MRRALREQQVEEVLNGAVLSDLYGTRVDVLRTHNRIVVVGVPEDVQGQFDQSDHHDESSH